MKKWWLGICCILLLWVAKLSYDQQQYNNEISQLQNQITKINQVTDHLNDQLVVRQGRTLQPHAQQNVEPSNSIQLFTPIQWIKQRLNLIQFALQQQQATYALEHLQALTHDVPHYDLAISLKQSLAEALLVDQESIIQYSAQKELQKKQINVLFKQIDQYLNQLQIKTVSGQAPKNQPTWFSLQSTAQTKNALMSQGIVIKEVQLRLLLAQQLFYSGQYGEYQSSIDEIQKICKQSPWLNQQDLLNILQQSKALTVLNIPSLQSIILIK